MHPAAVPDAVVVGSGPNGLAAAITLARAGRSVAVYEAADEPGGGCRTAELTLPGYRHDVVLGHPSDGARVALLPLPGPGRTGRGVHPSRRPGRPSARRRSGRRSSTARCRSRRTASAPTDAPGSGPSGGSSSEVDRLIPELLGPIVHWPRHPLALARFGLPALRSASGFARSRFSTDEAQGLFAGMAAHSMLPLDAKLSASFGLAFGLFGHGVGWPMVKGGSGALAQALVDELRSLGGEIFTERRVESFDELPEAKAVIFDTSPRAMLEICGGPAPGGLPTAPRALPLRPRHLQDGLGLVRARSPGRTRRSGERARSMSAARSGRSPRPKRRLPPAATPSARSSSSSSRASSTRRAPRRASTRPGRTATSRPDRRST